MPHHLMETIIMNFIESSLSYVMSFKRVRMLRECLS